MHYELVSRAIAYVSCLSTMSLFMTSVAIAAINVGKVRPLSCPPNACIAGNWAGHDATYGVLANKARFETAATKL